MITNQAPLSMERIELIDRIRGTALLGILLFNVQTFALFAFLSPEQVYQIGLDQPSSYIPTQFLIQLLIKGQFYTIYSFLFGLGFYMLYSNAIARGLNAERIYTRRLWSLLLLGLIHGLIFWFGDILHKYAIMGFSLLYFYHKSVRTLLRWAIGISSLALLIQIGKFAISSRSTTPDPELEKVILEVVNTWRHGSFLQVLQLQKLGVAMLWLTSILNGLANFAHIEIMFILGLIAGKLQLFQRSKDIIKRWKRPALLALPILLALKGFSCGYQLLWNDDGLHYFSLLSATAEFIATPFLSIIYLLGLSAILTSNKTPLWQWIGNTGRLGLSNYILQSLICSAIFYGYSGGLSGRLNLWQTSIAALAIYIFQIVLSNFWLRFYQTGPLEWLWKKISYSKEVVIVKE